MVLSNLGRDVGEQQCLLLHASAPVVSACAALGAPHRAPQPQIESGPVASRGTWWTEPMLPARTAICRSLNSHSLASVGMPATAGVLERQVIDAHQPQLGVCIGGQQRLLLHRPCPLVKVFSPIVAAAPVPKPALHVLVQLLCSYVLVPGRTSGRLPGTVHVGVRGNFIGLVICDEVIIPLQVKFSYYSAGTSCWAVMAVELAAMSTSQPLHATSQTVHMQCRVALFANGSVQLCHVGKLVCCCIQAVSCSVTSEKTGKQAGLP